jgi:hypothetical protein
MKVLRFGVTGRSPDGRFDGIVPMPNGPYVGSGDYDALMGQFRDMTEQRSAARDERDALAAHRAKAEAGLLITRATLTDARRFIVMACGESAPMVKIMLERIDAALADSTADSAEVKHG